MRKLLSTFRLPSIRTKEARELEGNTFIIGEERPAATLWNFPLRTEC